MHLKKVKKVKQLTLALLIATLSLVSVTDTFAATKISKGSICNNYSKQTNIKIISASEASMICNTKAQIKLPLEFRKPKFKSSNTKIATVTSKGKIKAHRLGVVKIIATSSDQKKTYKITVKPEKKSDVWLNHDVVFTDTKFQLHLESDKYDTSQVNLAFDSYYVEIDKKGKCNKIEFDDLGYIDYSYGLFENSTELLVVSPERVVEQLLWGENYDKARDSWDCIEAGIEHDLKVHDFYGLDNIKPALTPSDMKEQGLELMLDGEEMKDTIVYTPGEHEITIICGNNAYTRGFFAAYPINEALKAKNSAGYRQECKEVLDTVFLVKEQIITDEMTEREKVKAIHDYLIYNADYYNNGDISNVEDWAYGANAVLTKGEGVCQSYAVAFYMLATVAGLDCKYVAGYANGLHAWNQVKIDDKWYFIDCTWDDPIGGGHEYYEYYLSECGWSDHEVIRTCYLEHKVGFEEETYYLIG